MSKYYTKYGIEYRKIKEDRAWYSIIWILGLIIGVVIVAALR